MKLSRKLKFTSILCTFAMATQAFAESTANEFTAAVQLASAKTIRLGEKIKRIEAEHLLVKFKDTVSTTKMAALLSLHKGAKVQSFTGRLSTLHRIAVPAGHEEQVLAALRALPEVESAEYNELVPASGTANDPGLEGQWYLANISVPQAWDLSTGNNPIVVAILDSGVDVTHPDLANRITPGYNAVENTTDVRDVEGHGTAVAGSAVVETNNGVGLSSACWNCRIMPVRIASNVNGAASAYFSTIITGMQWAADHGANILNISYSDLYTSSSIGYAATYVKSKGGLVFGAAGNAGQSISTNLAPDIIFVSSTDFTNTKSSWSNYGPIIALSAPGNSIYTTNNGGGYANWSGTSFASPLAAGVAALMWSTNPSLSNAQVVSMMLQATDDLGDAGKDDFFGYGKVNALKAVQLALSPAPAPTPPPAPAPTPAPTPAPAPEWTWCADENGTCTFSGTRTVRYGAGTTFTTLTATDSIACNNATFGDPAYGVVKHCEFSTSTANPLPKPAPPPPPPPAPIGSWTRCAGENETCTFTGTRTVRYGDGDKYATKTATDSIACNNDTFGDPVYGVVKHCDYSN